MKQTVMNFARGCAVAAVLLGGATVSEAAPITLTNGASSVDLCLPTLCGGTFLLSNWIADGSAVTGFQQSLSGFIDSSPLGVFHYDLGTFTDKTFTHLTSSKATASFFNAAQTLGITVDYFLTELGGISHIQETVSLHNTSGWSLFAGASDGMQINTGTQYFDQQWHDVELATADYTPNPEPMTMVLLGTGLVAVARSRRRKVALA